MSKKMIFRFVLLSVTLVLICLTALIMSTPGYKPLGFPNGAKFAFSICDDTDLATKENIQPVYRFLDSLGMRITKTIWVYPTNDTSNFANRGQTLSDSTYRAYILDLQSKGFEIASHGVRGGNSTREEILGGMELFKEVIGNYPRVFINHSRNLDNLYWGYHRIEIEPLRTLYRWKMGDGGFAGHDSTSVHFWGDFAQEHIDYVVSFSFAEVNIASVNPLVPYHDPAKPFVKEWFMTSEGRDVDNFNRLLKPENLDRLEAEGGVCIVYTHLAYGFANDGILDSTFVARVSDLAARDAWIAPASEILDFMKEHGQGGQTLSFAQRTWLELKWLWEKLILGQT